jgi:hypothetical protein
MSIDGLTFLIVAILAIAGVLFFKYRQNRRPTDAELADWKEFLIKGNLDRPEKRPLVTTSELPATAYDAIESLRNPKLIREFNERLLSLRNEFAARTIQIEEASRRMAVGKPLSSYDDAILIREGLRNGESKNEPTTQDRNENEI